MTSRSYEFGLNSSEVPALYTLAEAMCDTPGGFDRYDYAKCVWLGSPSREHRLVGDHPWPTRERQGEEYVYSVPVLAGVDAANGMMLFVGKDNWKSVDDPDAWLVAERHLLRGDEREHRVLSVSVGSANDLQLALAPPSYDNLPPPMQRAIRTRSPYARTVLEGRLDWRYNLRDARLREGQEGSVQFEDIEALESMIVMIQGMRIERTKWENRQLYHQDLLAA